MATNRCKVRGAGFAIQNPAHDRVIVVRERVVHTAPVQSGVVQSRKRQVAAQQIQGERMAPVPAPVSSPTPVLSSPPAPVDVGSSSVPNYTDEQFEYESNTSEIILE
jgi:hypothetical protein